MNTLAGRYRLVERLGAGGMSVVWRAYDEVLGRQVAVKVLASKYAADPEYRAGVRKEARAAARLSHPHITDVYDYGEARDEAGDTVPFVVMELVEGQSLAQRLASGPLPWRTALEVGRQVAGALAAAHARGVVHRDVTPANIMLTMDGAKVVDFGISAVVGQGAEKTVMGTPAYVSPERLSGAPVQAATDVYSLGLVLYHAMAGGPPPAPLPPGVPAQLATLIAQCLAPSPEHRPDSRALADELAVLAGAAVPARPVTVTAPTAALPTTAAAPAGPQGTRMMPPQEYATAPSRGRGPRPQPPFRRSRWGWMVLAGSLLSVGLLLLWGFSALRGGTVGAAAPPSHAPSRAPVRHVPPPSPSPPDPRACSVGYKITLDLGSYFTAQLAIQNTGKADFNGWTVAFQFPQDQHVTSGLAGIWNQTDNKVNVHDLLYNRRIAQGATLTLDFVGSHHSKTNGAPSLVTVNGVRCQQIAQG